MADGGFLSPERRPEKARIHTDGVARPQLVPGGV